MAKRKPKKRTTPRLGKEAHVLQRRKAGPMKHKLQSKGGAKKPDHWEGW